MNRTLKFIFQGMLAAALGLGLVICANLPSEIGILDHNVVQSSKPLAPVQTYPPNGATNQSSTLTLRWMKVSGMTASIVQIATDFSFPAQLTQTFPVADTFKAMVLSPSASYYWRVRTIAASDTGAWSETFVFGTKGPAIEAPTPRLPRNGDTSIPVTVTLKWDTVANASGYTVELSPSSTFVDNVKSAGSTGDTSTFSGLLSNTTYYWHVRASSAEGSSLWSSRSSFTTTIAVPDAPVLRAPADNAVGLPLPAVLTWASDTGAHIVRYLYQTATDNTFSGARFDTTTDTSVVLDGLLNDQTYYWRVKAENRAGASFFSRIWSFKTFKPALETPQLVAPASGAKGQPTTLTLDWTPPPGATAHQLQVSLTKSSWTVPVLDSVTTPDSCVVSGLANSTTYYWRVRAKNAAGTSNWAGPDSFTTIITVPAQPTTAVPANGSGTIQIPVSLRWNSANGADSFQVQVSVDSLFSSTLYSDTVVTLSASVPSLGYFTKYFWRVRGLNGYGPGPWSLIAAFTTAALTLPSPVPYAPPSGSGNQPTSVAFLWSKVPGATKYRVQVSPSSAFTADIKTDSTLTNSDTSVVIGGLQNDLSYYWRVQADNGAGAVSPWTMPAWSFKTIIAPPDAPTLVGPADSAANLATSLTVSWSSVAGADSFIVQVANDPAFTAPLFQSDTVSAAGQTSLTINGLQTSKTYYWRVKSMNRGGVSAFSGVRKFTTLSPTLATPLLSSPADSAKNQAITVSLSWQQVSGATRYSVQVSTRDDFTVLVVDTSVTSLACAMNRLVNSTTYYWRIMAHNAAATSNWTVPRSFTTIITQPSVPVQVAPAHLAVNVPVPTTFTWNPSNGASTYELQVAADTAFQTKIVDTTNLTGSTVTVAKPVRNVTYHWRVQARNANGASGWSTYRSFTTVVDVPEAPTLAAPAKGALNVELSLQLAWNPAARATAYHVQVSAAAAFGTTIVDDTAVQFTSKSVALSSQGSVHYWRVRGKNAGGFGGWSEVRDFSTNAVPVAPVPLLPTNHELQWYYQPLVWNKVGNAASYTVRWSIDSSFVNDVKTYTTIDTSVVPDYLLLSKQFFWQVQAENSLGKGPWSPRRDVTVLEAAPLPRLLSPSQTGTVTSNSVKFTWENPGSAPVTKWWLQVATASDFQSGLLLSDSTLINPTKTSIQLICGQTLYWRVRARNAAGWGTAWSQQNFVIQVLNWKPTLLTTGNFYAFASVGTRVFAGGDSGKIYYSDNKTTWTMTRVAAIPDQISAIVVKGSTMYAATVGTSELSAGIYSSTDQTNWTPFRTGLTATSVQTLYATVDILLAGCVTEGVLRNNGSGWVQVNTGLTAQGKQVSSIAGTFVTIFAQSNANSAVFRTSDGGMNWSAAGVPLVVPPRLYGTSGTIYAYGGALYSSINDGNSWTQLLGNSSGTPTCMAVGGYLLYVGTKQNTGVLVSTDDGKTWGTGNVGLPAGDQSCSAMWAEGKTMYLALTGQGIVYSEIP